MEWVSEHGVGKVRPRSHIHLMLTLSQWIDPTSSLCGLFATQVVPAGDSAVAALQRTFEKAMYSTHKANL